MDEASTPLLDGNTTPVPRTHTVWAMLDENPSMNIRLVEQIANHPTLTSHALWEFADLPLDQQGSARHDVDCTVAGEDPVNPSATPRNTWNLIQGGAETSQLIKQFPGKVIAAIKLDGVRKLGDMQVEDYVAKDAFGSRSMLFRPFETANDGDWKANWEEVFDAAKERSRKKSARHGWQEMVTVSAYVVLINNAAGTPRSGIVHPLLLKYAAGNLPVTIFSLPAVQAVINFKWDSWASKYVIVEFCMYMAWLASFTFFLLLLQEHEPFNEESPRFWGLLFCIMSMAFMLPFVAFDILQLAIYRRGWLHVWNLVGVITYTIQILCFIGYMGSKDYGYGAFDLVTWPQKNWYSVIMAIQIILLFFKAQYFSRVFATVKGSFVDMLKVVIWDTRFFVIFVMMTMVSFAIAFFTLFRLDNMAEQNPQDATETLPEDAHEEFLTIKSSFATMFSFMLGGFDIEIFNDSGMPVVSNCFFIIYEFIMAVTLLNLLIAVMTESYSKVMAKEEVMNYGSRAQVIDELETTLPKCLTKSGCTPYLHFVMQRPSNDPVMRDVGTTGPVTEMEFRESRATLRDRMDSLEAQLSAVSRQLEGLAKS